jgi:hypothetical protein
MILTTSEVDDYTLTLKYSHEELRTLATLKETEAAIAWASLKDVQTNLLEMQRQLIQQQEMIQALLTNLAAGVKP